MAKSITLKSVFVAVLIATAIYVLLSMHREYSISEIYKEHIQERRRFDQVMASRGENYPVCDNLTTMEEDLRHQEHLRSEYETVFENFVEKELIHCGLTRVGGNFTIKK